MVKVVELHYIESIIQSLTKLNILVSKAVLLLDQDWKTKIFMEYKWFWQGVMGDIKWF